MELKCALGRNITAQGNGTKREGDKYRSSRQGKISNKTKVQNSVSKDHNPAFCCLMPNILQ